MNHLQDTVKVASGAALGRGLALLEHLSLVNGPVRFSDLQLKLPGIPDSTLTRLLRSLEALGYVSRCEGSGYLAGPHLLRWKEQLAVHPHSISEVAEMCVVNLMMRVNESAGVALMDGDRFYMIASQTADGGIHIAPKHSVMHFDSEHAAVLALFAALPEKRVQQVLAESPREEESFQQFLLAQEAARRPSDVYLDVSRYRPGISRMAVSFQVDGRVGAVFLCITQQQAEVSYEELSSALLASRQDLEERMRSRG